MSLEGHENIQKGPGRGGARSGAGRPKGSKASGPRRSIRVRLEPVAYDGKGDIRPLALRARDFTGLSLKAYTDCLLDPKAEHSDKIRAATELLNRGHGKSVEMVNVTTISIFAGMSDADIASTLAAIRSTLADRARPVAATDVTADTQITDGVGAAPGLPASDAPPIAAVVPDEGGEQRD